MSVRIMFKKGKGIILIIALVLINTIVFAFSYYDNMSIFDSVVLGIGSWHEDSDFARGDGTLVSPYEIETWHHLNNVRNNLSAYYELNNDLDSNSTGYSELASSTANNSAGWEPIGSINRFIGFFNGNSHTISYLNINRPDEDNVGLFGHIGISLTDTPTKIENISLANVDIVGGRGTGSIIGRVTGNNQTVIENVSVTGGTVNGTGATGGLIGSHNSFQEQGAADRNPQLLRSSSVNVNVIGRYNSLDLRIFEKIGGLVGCSQKGTVINCYAQSNVVVNNDVNDENTKVYNVGGLIGCNIIRGILQLSYSTGTVQVNLGENVGGLIGQVSRDGGHIPIANSYWDTESSDYAIGYGVGSTTDDGATGLITAQMQGSNAETNMSAFNFIDVWQTVITDYPILR